MRGFHYQPAHKYFDLLFQTKSSVILSEILIYSDNRALKD